MGGMTTRVLACSVAADVAADSTFGDRGSGFDDRYDLVSQATKNWSMNPCVFS